MNVYLSRSALYVAGFWCLWQVSTLFEFAPHVNAFYPAPGLTVAFTAVFGWRYLPVVFVGVSLGNHPWQVVWEFSWFDVCQVSRQSLVYGAAGLALRGLELCEVPLRRTSDVTRFLGVGLAAAASSGGLAVATFLAFDKFPPEDAAGVFLSFLVGDLSGVLMAAPLLMILFHAMESGHQRRLARNMAQARYAAVRAVVLPAVMSSLGFGIAGLGAAAGNFGYVIMLPVVWIAAQQGITGGVLAAVIANTSAFAILRALDLQNYSVVEQNYSVVELQVLFAATAAIGLLIGGAFDDRRYAERVARRSGEALSRMARAGSLEAMGSAIAHEVNQPLSVIFIEAQLAADRMRQGSVDDEMTRSINKIQTQADRASAIITRMRESSRDGGGLALSSISVNDEVRRLLRLIEPDIQRSGAEVETFLARDLPPVDADPVRLQQVLANLVLNGLDTAEEAMEPEVRIETRMADRERLVIVVRDNGAGISPEDREIIFMPFYTTKPRGVGMGLALCASIVEGLGGRIEVADAPGGGAEFRVLLPIANTDAP